CFANNKPWITSHVKDLLNKKRAFKNNIQEELRSAHRGLKVQLREAKESYRKKVEQTLRENNMREVWNGMKTITGYKQRTSNATDGDAERANEFNTFYNRFDCPVQAESTDNTAPTPPFSHLILLDLIWGTTEGPTSPCTPSSQT
ncbi:hypothetical protein NFI96_032536, partial [Prochilodus magdalenae]